MVAIDYMAHSEQYGPETLLTYARLAEDAGFEMIWTSDHFHPWFDTGGESGFAWSWLGGATQAIDLPLGTCVTSTAGHYHPGILAQATATLGVMHDRQIALGVSTGEAMNETPLGFDWPGYPERRDRLEETLEIVTALWEREGFVSYDGEYYSLDDAKLYTRPERRPDIVVAANGPSTAALAGQYADGFVTVLKDDTVTDRLLPAVRENAREAGRDPDAIETTLLVTASYHPDYDRAFEATRPWWAATQNVFEQGIADPREIERIGEQANRDEIEHKFVIADSPDAIVDQLERYADLGFDRIAVGNTSPEPELFFEAMSESVIPAL